MQYNLNLKGYFRKNIQEKEIHLQKFCPGLRRADPSLSCSGPGCSSKTPFPRGGAIRTIPVRRLRSRQADGETVG